jgi:hypothetical protein
MPEPKAPTDGGTVTVRVPFSIRRRSSHVGRVLRLTLLAPDMVEAVLNRRQPPEMTLAVLMRRFSVGWKEQRKKFLN